MDFLSAFSLCRIFNSRVAFLFSTNFSCLTSFQLQPLCWLLLWFGCRQRETNVLEKKEVALTRKGVVINVQNSYCGGS